jgi:hypothetical protein
MAKSFQKSLSPNPQKQLNKILALQKQNDMIAMLLDGKSTKEISDYIVHKYRTTPLYAANQISEARRIIKERKGFEAKELVLLHIARYEYIYNKLVEMKANGMAMKALQQKEKLMGFHKDGFHMRISKGQITSYQNSSVSAQYDPIRKLTPEKMARFEELMNKCRRDGTRKIASTV